MSSLIWCDVKASRPLGSNKCGRIRVDGEGCCCSVLTHLPLRDVEVILHMYFAIDFMNWYFEQNHIHGKSACLMPSGNYRLLNPRQNQVVAVYVGFTPSVCQSIHLSRIPCPLCNSLKFWMDPFHIRHKWSQAWEGVSHTMTFDLWGEGGHSLFESQ